MTCGSLGSHRQNFIINIFAVNCWKDENTEKESENGPFLNKKGARKRWSEAQSPIGKSKRQFWKQLEKDSSSFFAAKTILMRNKRFSWSKRSLKGSFYRLAFSSFSSVDRLWLKLSAMMILDMFSKLHLLNTSSTYHCRVFIRLGTKHLFSKRQLW